MMPHVTFFTSMFIVCDFIQILVIPLRGSLYRYFWVTSAQAGVSQQPHVHSGEPVVSTDVHRCLSPFYCLSCSIKQSYCNKIVFPSLRTRAVTQSCFHRFPNSVFRDPKRNSACQISYLYIAVNNVNSPTFRLLLRETSSVAPI